MYDFGMAYDEDRQQAILFGGFGPDSPETWAWDGQDWTQLQTFITPPEEMAYGAQLVYLPGLHSVVLFNDNSQKTCTINDCTISNESQMWALTTQYLEYLPIVHNPPDVHSDAYK